MHGRSSDSSFENPLSHNLPANPDHQADVSSSGSAAHYAEESAQPIDNRINAYFDGDLNTQDSCKIIRDLSRNPHNFEKIVKDQAWIDELKQPVNVPDVTPRVLKRLGLSTKNEVNFSRGSSGSSIKAGRGGLFVTRGILRCAMAGAVALALSLGWWLRTGSNDSLQFTNQAAVDSSAVPFGKVLAALTYDVYSRGQLADRLYDKQQTLADSIAPMQANEFSDSFIINDDLLVDKTRAFLPTPYLRKNTFAAGNKYTRYSQAEIDSVMKSKPALFTHTNFTAAPPLPTTTYPEIPGKVAKPEDLQSDSR